MRKERMDLLELLEKQVDGDLAREVLAFAADRVIQVEAGRRTGGAKGARSACGTSSATVTAIGTGTGTRVRDGSRR